MSSSYSILQPARLHGDASVAPVPRTQCRFRWSRFRSRLAAAAGVMTLLALAPGSRAEAGSSSSLPDAPAPQTSAPSGQVTGPGRVNKVFNVYVGPAYPLKLDDKWDTIVNA